MLIVKEGTQEGKKMEKEEDIVGESKSLQPFAVGRLPTVFYIPDIVTESEQLQLLDQIYQAPASKWKPLKNRRLQNWGGVVHEKGLLPQPLPPWLLEITDRIYKQTGLFPSAINHVLINEYLPEQGIMLHQDGPAYFPTVAILSLGSPVVMSFSPHPRLKECPSSSDQLNIHDFSHTKMCSEEPKSFSVMLMPRSLLIFKDSAYSDFLHGIEDSNVHNLDEVINDLGALNPKELQFHTISNDKMNSTAGKEQRAILRTKTRVSLTCRLVPKVYRNLFKI